jgi:P4 family phage/plasmid primase-like protien
MFHNQNTPTFEDVTTADTGPEWTPVTDSEPLPIPLPVGTTVSQFTAEPKPVSARRRLTDGIAPEVPIYAAATRRKAAAAKAAPPKAPGAAPVQRAEIQPGSEIAGGGVDTSAVRAAIEARLGGPVPAPAPAPAPRKPRKPRKAKAAAATPATPAPVAPAPPARVEPAAVAPADYSTYGELWAGAARVAKPEAKLLLQHAGLSDKLPEVRSVERVITGTDVRAYLATHGVAEPTIPPLLPPLTEAEAAAIVDTLLSHNLHLLPLHPESKAPVERDWPNAAAPPREASISALTGSGNIGWNVGASNKIVVDAENAAATAAMVAAGYVPSIATANGVDPTSPKHGGRHFVFDVPAGADPTTLRSVLQLPLNGGTVDLLAGARYAVAPGSQLWEARSGRYAALEPWASGTTNGPAPAWLWGHGEAPAAVAELAGALAPRAARVRTASPEGDALTQAIDEIPWSDWLERYDVDRLLSYSGVDGTCGCDVAEYAAAKSGPRSVLLHDGCAYGYMAKAFSGTLIADWGREAGSRLQLAAFLSGKSAGEIMRELGIGGGGGFAEPDDAGDGLPAVDPALNDYQVRAAQEAAARLEFPVDYRVDPRGLLPRDRRGLAETVFGPRAAAAPVSIRANQAEAAEVIALALRGRVVRDAERSTKQTDILYGWDGDRFREDKDAAETAVKGLLHARNFAADPAESQTKIQVSGYRKATPEEAAEQLQDAKAAAAARGEVLDEQKFKASPVCFTDPAWAGTDQTTKAVARMVARERACRVESTTEFDADPRIVGAPGGYIRLRDDGYEIVTPDPRYRVTKLLGARADAACPTPKWTRFLEQFQPDNKVRDYLQELAGSGLEGVQNHHLIPVLGGAGGNGKGVFIETLTHAFGDYFAAMQGRTITTAGQKGHAVDYMPLKGARMAVWDEVPGTQIDVELFKKLNGGGMFSVRGIGEAPITFPLSHQGWLTSNNVLEIPPGQRRALRRRLRHIHCPADFSGLPGSDGAPIVGLAGQMWREEGPGIVAWVLEGWTRHARRGFTFDEPASVTTATDAAMASMSTWSAFCAEVFTITNDPGDCLYVSLIFDLWRHYRGENSDQGYSRPGSARAVPRALEQELPPTVKVVPSYGKYKAHATGVTWSPAGLELIQEMRVPAYMHAPD